MNYTTEAYDIIIQAGQSNAEGCGRGPVSEEYIPDEDIKYLYQNYTNEDKIVDGIWKAAINIIDPAFYIATADERCDENGKIGDFSLTFCKEYKKNGFLKQGRKLLVIRSGVGGTGFKKKHWGLTDEMYLRMLDMIDHALSLNPENRLVAFLWHQGEHDAFEQNDPDVFEEQLRTMIDSVKSKYNTPDLPFISADFVNEWKNENIDICTPIVEKIKKVTREQGGVFIETADLPSNNQKTGNGDGIHFCRESLHTLGKRYFAAYRTIIERGR